MKLLDMKTADIRDPDMLQLIEELKELRQLPISDEVCLRHFFHCFFLSEDRCKFVPILGRELFYQTWLLAKVSQTRGTRIYELIREIALEENGMDTAANPRIYTALNSLFRPPCMIIIRALRRSRK